MATQPVSELVVSEIKAVLISGLVWALTEDIISRDSIMMFLILGNLTMSRDFRASVIYMQAPSLRNVAVKIGTDLALGWCYWMTMYDPRRTLNGSKPDVEMEMSVTRKYLNVVYLDALPIVIISNLFQAWMWSLHRLH